jgi:hypothetical protein
VRREAANHLLLASETVRCSWCPSWVVSSYQHGWGRPTSGSATRRGARLCGGSGGGGDSNILGSVVISAPNILGSVVISARVDSEDATGGGSGGDEGRQPENCCGGGGGD